MLWISHIYLAVNSKFTKSTNVGKATNFYNSGGFYVEDAVKGSKLYEEYRAGEDDG